MNIKKLFKIMVQMGPRYVGYRLWHEALRRSGILKSLYPLKPKFKNSVSLNVWRKAARPFFFNSREELNVVDLPQALCKQLKIDAERIKAGEVQFFNGKWINLGEDHNWITNPVNGFCFDSTKHWTAVKDIDPKQGDIKYVWEKPRFCYLYTLIRNDFHNNEDSSEFVCKEILSWINHNPVNCGPNYKCSQEISLRVLNWVFALYFYRNADILSKPSENSPSSGKDISIFEAILSAIYWQACHVEQNINFSRFTVRNNHAITEALCLYTLGLLFPWFKKAKRWKRKGRRFLEEEGLHQIAPDGTYIQNSVNYERVAAQLYVWALSLADANGECFSDSLNTRLESLLLFLSSMQMSADGQLPNYGPNDGSLIFPLSANSFSDYRPIINTLSYSLHKKHVYDEMEIQEPVLWFSSKAIEEIDQRPVNIPDVSVFPNGGYYAIKAPDKAMFIRCANNRYRPAESDNLHCDLWYKGKNIIRDSGTHGYQPMSQLNLHFASVFGHNTVAIQNENQMEKGARFIWLNWSTVAGTPTISEEQDFIVFIGSIRAFKHINPNIVHKRIIKQHKFKPLWIISDYITGSDGNNTQIWNLYDDFFKDGWKIAAADDEGRVINSKLVNGYYARTYGEYKKIPQIQFQTDRKNVITEIELSGK